jgi:hypothetical protein
VDQREELTLHLLLLLLLLLLEHVRLLGLQVLEGMRIGTDARLHARHHRTRLANGSIRPRDAGVHLHALLHGVAGAWSSHHMALGHLHTRLWRKVRRLHHLVRRGLRAASGKPTRTSDARSIRANGEGFQSKRCRVQLEMWDNGRITAQTCPGGAVICRDACAYRVQCGEPRCDRCSPEVQLLCAAPEGVRKNEVDVGPGAAEGAQVEAGDGKSRGRDGTATSACPCRARGSARDQKGSGALEGKGKRPGLARVSSCCRRAVVAHASRWRRWAGCAGRAGQGRAAAAMAAQASRIRRVAGSEAFADALEGGGPPVSVGTRDVFERRADEDGKRSPKF